MIVTRRINKETNDLLKGNERLDLIVCDLGSDSNSKITAPSGGWTHELLEDYPFNENYPFGWDAYLGSKNNWIGSSEC